MYSLLQDMTNFLKQALGLLSQNRCWLGCEHSPFVSQAAPVLMDPEVCPSLHTVMRNYFQILSVLSALDPTNKLNVKSFAKRWISKVEEHEDQHQHSQGGGKTSLMLHVGNCRQHPLTRKYSIAPAVEGRIINIKAPHIQADECQN